MPSFFAASRQQIRVIVWKDSAEYVSDHTIGVHVANMRKKLGNKAHYIVNRKGFGYKFDQDEE